MIFGIIFDLPHIVKFLRFYILVFSINVARAQIVQSSCSAPDSVLKQYQSDADRMAVFRVNFKITSAYTDSVHIDPALRKRYLDALIAVYNATMIPARDSVINKYHIHRLWEPLNNIVVNADSNYLWMKNFRNNIYPVGNSFIDSLRLRHYLVKQYYYTYGQMYPYHTVVLKTDTNCNTFALCSVLQYSVQGNVISAYPDYSTPFSVDIKDSVNNNFIELTYRYGWGDCEAGCIYNRYWKFKMFNDCSVLYEGSYGSPLGIDKIKLDEDEVSIFPNPATDLIKINGKGVTNVQIIDFTGSILISLALPADKIDISRLPSGFYFVRVTSHKCLKSFRLIKN